MEIEFGPVLTTLVGDPLSEESEQLSEEAIYARHCMWLREADIVVAEVFYLQYYI